MKPGDHVRFKREDSNWLVGTVVIAAPNGRSLMLILDEGLPVPFALLGDKQAIAILKGDDGSWQDLHTGRSVTLDA